MSDFSKYELGDIIWDDFDRGDDHIVSHPTSTQSSRNSFKGDNSNKLLCETTLVLSKTDSIHAFNTKPLDKKKNIMEKESPSNTAPSVFNASFDGDIVKDMPNLDTRMTNNCFKSSYGTSSTTGDNNSYSYTLTQADLCFVDNNCEKESSDLLYYGWSDIGNFEDVDKMLRSCDSSFGVGAIDHDDWFSSGRIEGTEEAFKMDFKFPCSEPSGLKNRLHQDDSSISNNHRFACISESKDELNFKDQNKLSKQQDLSEGKEAGQHIGNDDGSFYQTSELTCNDSWLSSTNTSDQVFTSVDNQQHYRNLQTDYFSHMQNNSFYLNPHHPHQNASVPALSNSKSEHIGLKSTSPVDSSYESNRNRSTESSGDPSFEEAVVEADELKESGNSQGFRQMGMMFQSSKGVLDFADKEGNLSVREHESESDIGVPKGVKIGSLNVHENSSVKSELDEISLEATSFCHLRQAMEQLDLRSKLCIRDSLYRLARSAEQRHNDPNLSSRNDLGGPLMVDTSNKCTGFMDIETNTNPIDRSVAHLLFHRPSESIKSPTPLPHNQNLGPSMLAEKLVCQEEAAAEPND